MLFELYRKGFNVIDLFNKASVGKTTVAGNIHAYSDWKTVFVGLLSMSVTNTYRAFLKCMPDTAKQFGGG